MQDVPSLPGTVATAALENNAVISGTSGQSVAQDPAFGGVVTNALTPESQPATPQPAIPQPVNPQPRVNHLKIDSSEFKIAVEVPRLGMDRMLHSAMLHGKLNDLLERGLISYDAARAAFRQAQHNQIGW
jgi:dihydroorotate dehydrogenase